MKLLRDDLVKTMVTAQRFTIGDKLARALGFFLGALFVASGVAKLWDIYAFSEVVRRYGILPESLVVPVSILVPFVEFVLGVMLLMYFRLRIVSIGLTLLVASFTILSFIRYKGGDVSECGCFGKLFQRQFGWGLFAENFALILALLTIIVHDEKVGF